MQVTRRDFLKILVLSPIVGITAGHASNKCCMTVSWLNITIPMWLFDEKSKKNSRVQALTIVENKAAKEIVVLFERNRQLTLNSDVSVQWFIQRNASRPTRESMLLKRIVSYSLDAIFMSITNKRHPEKGASLREEFNALQAEEVIEKITVGAMYDVLSKLNNFPVISSVRWISSKQQFIVI